MFELVFYQSVEELIWLTLPFFYVAGMVLIFAFPICAILFWKKWMPKPARTLFWASRRKTPPLLLCHDSGRGELTTIHERKGEGTVMTAQGKFKILPRFAPRMPLSAMLGVKEPAVSAPAANGSIVPTSSEETQDPPEQPAATLNRSIPEVDLNTIFNVKFLKENFILDYSDWVVKRTSLIGLDMPFFVGYTGKLCLLNPEALALYEAGEMMIRTSDGIMFNPKNAADKKMENAFQPLLLLDGRKINQIIYSGFDQSQIAAVVADSEELARIGQGMSPKMKLILVVLLIAIVAGAALFFLPQLMGGIMPKQQAATVAFFRRLLHI